MYAKPFDSNFVDTNTLRDPTTLEYVAESSVPFEHWIVEDNFYTPTLMTLHIGRACTEGCRTFGFATGACSAGTGAPPPTRDWDASQRTPKAI